MKESKYKIGINMSSVDISNLVGQKTVPRLFHAVILEDGRWMTPTQSPTTFMDEAARFYHGEPPCPVSPTGSSVVLVEEVCTILSVKKVLSEKERWVQNEMETMSRLLSNTQDDDKIKRDIIEHYFSQMIQEMAALKFSDEKK